LKQNPNTEYEQMKGHFKSVCIYEGICLKEGSYRQHAGRLLVELAVVAPARLGAVGAALRRGTGPGDARDDLEVLPAVLEVHELVHDGLHHLAVDQVAAGGPVHQIFRQVPVI